MPHPIPANALHAHYAASGGHVDCYCAIVPRHARDQRGGVSLADFVYAFYTSPLFRLERWILAVLLGRPSTDAEALAVARGPSIRGYAAPQDERNGVEPFDGLRTGAQFAAWTVEARTDDQLLMCDYQGRTRSWFMVDPGESRRVYFGTAIAAAGSKEEEPSPRPSPAGGRGGRKVPFAFRALMPFHRLYSRALLWSAVRGLRRR